MAHGGQSVGNGLGAVLFIIIVGGLLLASSTGFFKNNSGQPLGLTSKTGQSGVLSDRRTEATIYYQHSSAQAAEKQQTLAEDQQGEAFYSDVNKKEQSNGYK